VKEKLRCLLCDSTDVEYLDKVIRETPYGERYEEVFECRTCHEMFNVPIELPYGADIRKAKR